MIALTASFAAVGDGDPPSFDGFREAAGSAHFEELRFFVREGNALDEQGMRVLMRSVLRREQLTWALEKGVLRLQRSYFEVETGIWKDVAYISNAVLLSLSAGRSVIAINDTPPTLDIDEAAECFSQVVIGQEISDYLQRLPALRAERAKAKKGSSEETSGTPETQDGVVPAQRTAKDTSKLPESPNTAPPSRQIRAAGGEGDEDGKEEAGQDMGGL
ncbi:hypothetical protein PsYK624_063090 [Phanerochaete sordida]|uniref:Uncharacterized protein n=1 Tax=Phanerochaete sordida TaxID=48140 RepID=A0A9P3G6I5_9APHY|nr:hypothetical protein PsYK624_063090 [Phanerochaete sordida]